jgi:hypothetical protein
LRRIPNPIATLEIYNTSKTFEKALFLECTGSDHLTSHNQNKKNERPGSYAYPTDPFDPRRSV